MWQTTGAKNRNRHRQLPVDSRYIFSNISAPKFRICPSNRWKGHTKVFHHPWAPWTCKDTSVFYNFTSRPIISSQKIETVRRYQQDVFRIIYQIYNQTSLWLRHSRQMRNLPGWGIVLARFSYLVGHDHEGH